MKNILIILVLTFCFTSANSQQTQSISLTGFYNNKVHKLGSSIFLQFRWNYEVSNDIEEIWFCRKPKNEDFNLTNPKNHGNSIDLKNNKEWSTLNKLSYIPKSQSGTGYDVGEMVGNLLIPFDFNHDTSYHYYIAFYDVASFKWNTSVAAEFESAIKPISPLDNSILPAGTITFEWNPNSSSQASYSIQIADKPFAEIDKNENKTQGTFYTKQINETNHDVLLEYGGTYYWRIGDYIGINFRSWRPANKLIIDGPSSITLNGNGKSNLIINNILTSSNLIKSLYIMNLNGDALEKLNVNSTNFDLNFLSSGFYILKIETENEVIYNKFIKI